MKTIFARIKGETPAFFKGVIKVGIALTAIGSAILGLPAGLAAAGVVFVVPSIVTTIGGLIATGGVVATAIGNLPVVNPENLPK